jgi:hypothetical protein
LNDYLLNRSWHETSIKKHRNIRITRNPFLYPEEKNYLDLINSHKKLKRKVISELKMSNVDLGKTVNEEVSDLIKKNVKYSEIQKCFNFLTKAKIHESNEFEYNFSYRYDDKNHELYISCEEIRINDIVLVGYNYKTLQKGKKIRKLYSDFIPENEIKKYNKGFNQTFSDSINQPFYSHRNPEINLSENIFGVIIFSIFKNYQQALRDNFRPNYINNVGPLRAAPKRYYFHDNNIEGFSVLRTDDGDNLSQILKESKKLKDKVNEWLKIFGLKVDVVKVKDTIHRLNVKQNDLNLDITDVGFGVSQILPIILQGFASQQGSMTIIEQPEIHIHPKMQSSLADLFIAMAGEKDQNYLIETHSEYFLRRLRRRMSENEELINSVAIYFVEKIQNKTVLRKLEIDPNGGFEFPKDFYENELEDNIAFLKNM